MIRPSSETDGPIIRILTPVYNEAESLPLFERAVRDTLLSRTDCHCEILFIDDGSTDSSWHVIRDICAREGRFNGIRLSRNFGSHVAISAGLAAAGDADAVAILACDLQDPPEVVLQFVAEWRAGARIVWGRRRTRGDERWRVAASAVFQRLMRRFAMPSGSKFTTGSFLLMDRKVVDCVCRFQEQSRIVFALVAWTGFEQAVVLYDRNRRRTGKSRWTFIRMLKTMYDALIGFSSLPVHLMTVAGIMAIIVSIGLSAYLFVSWTTGHPAPGWTSIMFGIAFFFGLQFLLMGLSGEYLHRIYLEVVRRPLYFISDTTPRVDERANSATLAPGAQCLVAERVGESHGS